MLQDRNFTSFLQRLNPASKLWLALAVTLSVCLVRNIYYDLAIIALSIIMIVKEKKIVLFKLILISITILFFAMYGIYGAIAPNIDQATDTVMFTVLGIKYYESGLAYATMYYMRIAPLMCALFLIFLTIDTTDLGVVMCRAGIPYKFVFTFIDSFQVITLLNKDMEQIRDAQRARGLNTEGNLLKRFKAFIPIMVPVVANSIIKVQDQAIAMETKGFNAQCQKTVYRELTFTPQDMAVKIIGIAISIFSIAYAVLVKFSVIPRFLSNII
jgi:energy-coupling factor transport system permease protein